MKRFGLATVLVMMLCFAANAGDVKTVITEIAFFYNNFDAFESTRDQVGFGAATMKKAMLRDMAAGHCMILPKGTRVQVIDKIGTTCVVSVEGYQGRWITLCGFFK